MGLGYALSEELAFDEQGRPKATDFKTYKLFRTVDMPKCQVAFVDSYEKAGPFGGKSIGECAVVPVAPAVANAVYNATDVEIHSLPIKLK